MLGKFKRVVLLGLGGLAVALGVIGIFLPLLPTTPFLLLAGLCFSQSSPRFEAWLLEHSWFGPPIKDWRRNRVIRVRAKILASAILASSTVWLYQGSGVPIAIKIVFPFGAALLLLWLWTCKSKP